MIQALEAFWRGRTARERLLVTVAGVLAVFVAAPLGVYRAAADYRAEARAELASAQAILADAQALAYAARRDGAAASGAKPADGSVRGIAVATAEALGLTLARIEPAGPDRLRLALQNANSVQVYHWIEALGRRGVRVERASLVRAGPDGLVAAEFDLAGDR